MSDCGTLLKYVVGTSFALVQQILICYRPTQRHRQVLPEGNTASASCDNCHHAGCQAALENNLLSVGQVCCASESLHALETEMRTDVLVMLLPALALQHLLLCEDDLMSLWSGCSPGMVMTTTTMSSMAADKDA